MTRLDIFPNARLKNGVVIDLATGWRCLSALRTLLAEHPAYFHSLAAAANLSSAGSDPDHFGPLSTLGFLGPNGCPDQDTLNVLVSAFHEATAGLILTNPVLLSGLVSGEALDDPSAALLVAEYSLFVTFRAARTPDARAAALKGAVEDRAVDRAHSRVATVRGRAVDALIALARLETRGPADATGIPFGRQQVPMISSCRTKLLIACLVLSPEYSAEVSQWILDSPLPHFRTLLDTNASVPGADGPALVRSGEPIPGRPENGVGRRGDLHRTAGRGGGRGDGRG